MEYLAASVGSVYNPKLLGSYEIELHPIIASLPALGVTRCVDIGAAEGYYAVGLARLLKCPVECFEIEPAGQKLVRELAVRNDLSDKVSVLGRCDPEALESVLSACRDFGPTLIVCDVEGFEDVLLDLATVPTLHRCHLLVEVHDAFVPGVGDRLCGRFKGTHRCERIPARHRTAEDFPAGSWWARFVPDRLKVRLMVEGRPPQMYWLWLCPTEGREVPRQIARP